jgi:uncharacterized membrane protein
MLLLRFMRSRPITVTCLAWLYMAVGVFSTAFHVVQFTAHPPTADELFWIPLLGLLAVLAGVFLLRGSNWARWLALAWMAFHVALSVFHPLHELLVHSLFLALFAYLLFRPAARAYFHSQPTSAV